MEVLLLWKSCSLGVHHLESVNVTAVSLETACEPHTACCARRPGSCPDELLAGCLRQRCRVTGWLQWQRPLPDLHGWACRFDHPSRCFSVQFCIILVPCDAHCRAMPAVQIRPGLTICDTMSQQSDFIDATIPRTEPGAQ